MCMCCVNFHQGFINFPLKWVRQLLHWQWIYGPAFHVAQFHFATSGCRIRDAFHSNQITTTSTQGGRIKHCWLKGLLRLSFPPWDGFYFIPIDFTYNTRHPAIQGFFSRSLFLFKCNQYKYVLLYSGTVIRIHVYVYEFKCIVFIE